jgi:hypothetical protein
MNTQRSPEPIALEEFVAEDHLTTLIDRGDAHRNGCLLWLRDGRMYALQDAVRILGNVSHETDPYGFTGTTDTLASMLRRGFVMNSERVALGRSVYDVAWGYLVQRISGSPDASGANPVMR